MDGLIIIRIQDPWVKNKLFVSLSEIISNWIPHMKGLCPTNGVSEKCHSHTFPNFITNFNFTFPCIHWLSYYTDNDNVSSYMNIF